MSKQYLNRPEQPLEQPLGSRVVLQARVEELEAEVERTSVALSAAGMEKNALLAEKMAENEKLRGENDLLDKLLSVATAERDDWCRRTHGAEAEVEKLRKRLDEAWAATSANQVAHYKAEVEKLRARNGCTECRAETERAREELKDSRNIRRAWQGRAERAEAKLAEVEKELHEVCASHEALRQSSLERLASIERAREQLLRDGYDPHDPVIRLLSGKAE